MKRYLALAMFVVLAVSLTSPFSVSAKTKAGVKPGSFFYLFDKTFEKANLFFTFNPEKKAKKALENAEERLAEAEESASENKPEAVKTAMENYQKNIEVLEKVLAKVPEEAKEAIEKAIEADKERREEMTKKIEEINNEIKNEDNDLKKDEEEKSNDDVGDNENGKEENGNGNEYKKDEQSKEIEKLKKEVEILKNKSNANQINTKEVEKNNPSQVSKPQLIPKTQPISLASGSIKEKINYVVQIICPVNGGTSSGTGSLIYGNSSTDSKILTNKHVLTGATGPCGIYRTQSYENAPVLYFKSGTSFVFSKDYDLAIITPDVKTLTSYPNTNFQFNQSIDVFDRSILVLGYPSSAGNNITLTKGVISGSENINGVVMYKTDAKIDNGNSGGAVFDEDGKFMGVPTLASQGNFASYGYIIPAQVIKNFLDLVEQEGYGKQNWQHPQLSLYTVNPSNTVPDLAPRTPQNPAPQPQEDSSLKIARCQAKRDADYSTFVSKTDQMIADAIQKIKDEENTTINEQLRLYDACLIERPDVLKQYDSTLSPDSLCDFYRGNAKAQRTQTDKLIADIKASKNTFLSQGKAATDNEYYHCINK